MIIINSNVVVVEEDVNVAGRYLNVKVQLLLLKSLKCTDDDPLCKYYRRKQCINVYIHISQTAVGLNRPNENPLKRLSKPNNTFYLVIRTVLVTSVVNL